jgi:DNA-binding protein HU-beta
MSCNPSTSLLDFSGIGTAVVGSPYPDLGDGYTRSGCTDSFGGRGVEPVPFGGGLLMDGTPFTLGGTQVGGGRKRAAKKVPATRKVTAKAKAPATARKAPATARKAPAAARKAPAAAKKTPAAAKKTPVAARKAPAAAKKAPAAAAKKKAPSKKAAK